MKKLLLGLLLTATTTLQAQLKSETFITRNGDLDNAWHQISSRKKATVAFLGGSITNMDGWRNKVCDYLKTTYPSTTFTFLNAGIPSLGSLPHAFRLQQDVLDKGKPDLLFIEAAVNDNVNGTPETTQRRAMEGIVRHAFTANPAMNIVLMAFADEEKMKDYHAGKVPVTVQVHADIARRYHLPFINLAKEVTDRIDAGEFTWKDDFKDLHPSPFGQEIYFKAIRQLLDVSFNKPAPARVKVVKLPAAAERFNYSSGRYLDIHTAINKRGFDIHESWTPADNVHTRPGFVKVPMLVSSRKEASLDVPFTGTVIGVALLSGPDAGMLRYSIDDGPQQEVDTYTQWSKGLYLPWYLVLGDGLATGRHILHLQVGNVHEGTGKEPVCRIVHFLVNG